MHRQTSEVVMKRALKNILVGTTAMAVMTLTSLPAAHALDVGVSLGGVSAGASVGGGDNGGVSAGASASLGGNSGVSAGASAGIGGGNGVDAGVTASVGGGSGVDADVDVSIGGGSGVGVGVGVGVGGGTGGGTGGGGGASGGGGSVLAAYNNMSGSEQARIRKTCLQVLASTGGYERDLVQFCRMLRKLR